MFVFLGGGLGSVGRYLISLGVSRLELSSAWSVLVANTLACLLLVLAARSFFSHWDLLFKVGFLGGLSTFSALTLEILNFYKNGLIADALIFTLLNMILGIATGSLIFL